MANIGDPDRARELAGPEQARSLPAQALTTGRREASLDALVQVSPAAVLAIAEVYLSTPALAG